MHGVGERRLLESEARAVLVAGFLGLPESSAADVESAVHAPVASRHRNRFSMTEPMSGMNGSTNTATQYRRPKTLSRASTAVSSCFIFLPFFAAQPAAAFCCQGDTIRGSYGTPGLFNPGCHRNLSYPSNCSWAQQCALSASASAKPSLFNSRRIPHS